MYAIGHEPEPVEKIRKPQWTIENTRETQKVVDGLSKARNALMVVTGPNSPSVHAIDAAITRFTKLDPKVTA